VLEYWIVDYRARTIEVFVLEEGTYALLEKSGPGEVARSKVLAGVVPSLYLRFGKREAWPSSSRPSAGAQR